MSKLRNRIDAIERRHPATNDHTRDQLQRDVSKLFGELRRWEREVNDFLPNNSTVHRSWRQPTPDLFERLSTDQQALFSQLLEVDATF